MTCLYIITLAITSCIDAPPPQMAVCPQVEYCTIDKLPAWASYYNPELCKNEDWNTNCFYDEEGNATWEYLGDGTPTAEGYGRYMACPMGMYSKTVTFEHAGTWQCRDHGSAINVRYGERYTANGFVTGWHVVFDFLLREPEWWTYSLLDIYEVN